MERASYYERDGQKWNLADYKRAEARIEERAFIDLFVEGQKEPAATINVGPATDKWGDEARTLARKLNKRIKGKAEDAPDEEEDEEVKAEPAAAESTPETVTAEPEAPQSGDESKGETASAKTEDRIDRVESEPKPSAFNRGRK